MSTLLFSSLQIKTPKKIPFPKINGWDEKELCSWNVPQSFAPFLSSRVCGQKLRPDQCPPSWKDESCRWRQSRSHHLARSSCSPAPSPLESICPQTCAHSRQLWAQQAEGQMRGVKAAEATPLKPSGRHSLEPLFIPTPERTFWFPDLTEKLARFSPHSSQSLIF